ncbi:MAG: dihydrofolate reductase family protein [Hydrotalea sp.]|nr:dihydrofolate reductase family protein [Hydrotalea sp.]
MIKNNKLSLQDEEYLNLCLALSSRHLGLTGANPSVAAVLATPASVIDVAITAVLGRPHAEEILFARHSNLPPSATLYLSLEPCAHQSPHRTNNCATTIANSAIKRVVVAALDPNPNTHGAGMAMMEKSGKSVLRADEKFQAMARKLHQGFFYAMEKSGEENRPRPLVAAKIALSADGIAVPPAGQPRQITRGQLQFFAQYLRCRYDGLLVSAKTIITDDPLLTIRERGLESMARPRFVLEGNNRLSGKEKIFQTTQQPLIIFTAEKNNNLPASAKQIILPADNHGHFNLHDVLAAVVTSGVNRLLVETGGGLADELHQQNLLDELWLCQQQDVFLADASTNKNNFIASTATILKTTPSNIPSEVFAFDNNTSTAKKYDIR